MCLKLNSAVDSDSLIVCISQVFSSLSVIVFTYVFYINSNLEFLIDYYCCFIIVIDTFIDTILLSSECSMQCYA